MVGGTFPVGVQNFSTGCTGSVLGGMWSCALQQVSIPALTPNSRSAPSHCDGQKPPSGENPWASGGLVRVSQWKGGPLSTPALLSSGFCSAAGTCTGHPGLFSLLVLLLPLTSRAQSAVGGGSGNMGSRELQVGSLLALKNL